MAYAKRMHVVAVPYPAQGHIVPLMQLCKKLAREEGCMVTFVNTEHNHARMLQAQAAQSTHRSENEIEDSIEKKNIRLVGIPGGTPPELHGNPLHVVGAFQASEDLCGPFEKLLDKLAQEEGDDVTCIISDVLMSWTQNCADRVGVPRVAFWTSSAAVYHVIWHTYCLILRGIPPFKAANTIFEDNNTEMVSCIPGLPPMDLNDLPIIVRSDPADFIYQFLSRQLQPMLRAAAVLLNTFSELEPDCLQALASTFAVPTFAIGPLLPPSAAAAADGNPPDGAANGPPRCLLMKDKQEIVQDKPLSAEDNLPHSTDAASFATSTIQPVPKAGNSPGGKAKSAATYGSAGIFSEDLSCLQWLDKKESGSVLYISFGSIFGMSPEQFTELLEGLHASKQAFLWAIRPGFVQGWSNYTNLLPPTFLEKTKDQGMLVSWVPQLGVLAHHAIGGFLTHCGWNSTLESVTLGVPMLCWPDVGERRTNGRLVVSMWEAGLEFSCSISSQTNTRLISRQEVKQVINLLMDPCSHAAARLRTNASTLQSRARAALAQNGSSSKEWNRFLKHIREA